MPGGGVHLRLADAVRAGRRQGDEQDVNAVKLSDALSGVGQRNASRAPARPICPHAGLKSSTSANSPRSSAARCPGIAANIRPIRSSTSTASSRFSMGVSTSLSHGYHHYTFALSRGRERDYNFRRAVARTTTGCLLTQSTAGNWAKKFIRARISPVVIRVALGINRISAE